MPDLYKIWHSEQVKHANYEYNSYKTVFGSRTKTYSNFLLNLALRANRGC